MEDMSLLWLSASYNKLQLQHVLSPHPSPGLCLWTLLGALPTRIIGLRYVYTRYVLNRPTFHFFLKPMHIKKLIVFSTACEVSPLEQRETLKS